MCYQCVIDRLRVRYADFGKLNWGVFASIEYWSAILARRGVRISGAEVLMPNSPDPINFSRIFAIES